VGIPALLIEVIGKISMEFWEVFERYIADRALIPKPRMIYLFAKINIFRDSIYKMLKM
jgi:hypothetical protein